jgi:hypothetical protein
MDWAVFLPKETARENPRVANDHPETEVDELATANPTVDQQSYEGNVSSLFKGVPITSREQLAPVGVGQDRHWGLRYTRLLHAGERVVPDFTFLGEPAGGVAVGLDRSGSLVSSDQGPLEVA